MIKAWMLNGIAWPAAGGGITGRYVKFTWTGDWGSGAETAFLKAYFCDGDGVKFNDETMVHTCYHYAEGSIPGPSSTAGSYVGLNNENPYLPAWWKVDLGVGVSALIKQFKLQAHPSLPGYLPKNFTILVSDDDVTYTEILSAQSIANTLLQTFNTINA